MMEKIKSHLEELELREGIRILYACESGSRAWGFESEDSDYDVRFLYVREPAWYLRVDHEFQRDVVEEPIEDLLDVSGWDLKKALLLLRKSNPALVEWLHSPTVYRADEEVLAGLRGLLDVYYSPRACFYHYTHMASHNNREFLQGDMVRIKKYLYVLRPLLAMKWIEAGRGIVPVEFNVLVDAMVDDPGLLWDIRELLEQKRRGFESTYMPRVDSISRFIDAELSRLQGEAQKLGNPKADFGRLNEFFFEVLNA